MKIAKFLFKAWLFLAITVIVFYDTPVYIFSDNLHDAVSTMELTEFVPKIAKASVTLPTLRSDYLPARMANFTADIMASGHYHTNTTVGAALDSNPYVKEYEVVPYMGRSSPLDNSANAGIGLAGLRIVFKDATAVELFFLARSKRFFAAQGARVGRLVDVKYHLPNGSWSRHGRTEYGKEDAMAAMRVGLAIFVKNPAALPNSFKAIIGSEDK